ncbi:hypothetical protein I4U23_022548 [Adineta vaga]|nr:hypothetical protein I4U23_022548 [Adineta vaga]
MTWVDVGGCDRGLTVKLPPIYGFRSQKLVSLDEALKPIESQIDQLQYYIKTAKKYCHYPSEHGLTRDESASIYIYTMEWGEQTLYRLLNQALRNENRHIIKIWTVAGTHVVVNPIKIDARNNRHQLWSFNNDSTIRHLNSGLVLDIHGVDKRSLIVFTHHAEDNQKWRVDSETGYIINPPTNNVVDIEYPNTQAGARVIAWPKDTGSNQKWELVAKFN